MAFISKSEVQEKQKKLAKLNKQFNVSARFGGSNTHNLNLTIQSGAIDFIGNYCKTITSKSADNSDAAYYACLNNVVQVNHYHMANQFDGEALKYLNKALEIMHENHFDESDPMTDHFNCAWYIRINVGKFNKPFKFVNA